MGLALGRLRMPAWPFKGAVAIVEEDAVQAVTEFHVASDWRYLGSTRSPSEIDELQRLDPLPAFDVDLYRILLRVLRDHTYARLLDLPGSRRDQTVAAHDPLSP
jgi:DNA polymerase-3 subunit epsilon